MITIQTFSSVTIAELAKNLLQGQGVPAFVQRGEVGLGGLVSDTIGVGLAVAEADAKKAKKILKTYFKET